MRTIWLLHVTHKHGDDCIGYTTEQGAIDAATRWARQWWDTEMPEGSVEPADDEECRHAYFDAVAGREWYAVVQCVVHGEDE